ncbi:hypothetical protein [Thauera humireducens]|uniref:hypothetical protein n=1 Tax=Thauera humireducens TaxID=1134435 RepID=UPI0031200CA9
MGDDLAEWGEQREMVGAADVLLFDAAARGLLAIAGGQAALQLEGRGRVARGDRVRRHDGQRAQAASPSAIAVMAAPSEAGPHDHWPRRRRTVSPSSLLSG